jgi:hypothetical protein
MRAGQQILPALRGDRISSGVLGAKVAIWLLTCAVGAGVTGGAIFALTAWMALAAMWAGALVTNYLVDERPAASTISNETIGAAR